jgi:hypothetical protein
MRRDGFGKGQAEPHAAWWVAAQVDDPIYSVTADFWSPGAAAAEKLTGYSAGKDDFDSKITWWRGEPRSIPSETILEGNVALAGMNHRQTVGRPIDPKANDTGEDRWR